MFSQPLINDSSKHIPNSPSLQKLVVELDEGNEELLSGGQVTTRQNETNDSNSNLVIALVLLFANPFA